MVISASCLYSQAETRAEFAERSVAKLEKTIDDLEGKGGRPSTPKLHSLRLLAHPFSSPPIISVTDKLGLFHLRLRTLWCSVPTG